MLRLNLSQKNIFRAGLILILVSMMSAAFAQVPIDCSKVLDQQPNFVNHQLLQTDSLLQSDVRILKHREFRCGVGMYRNLENKKADLKTWDTDQQLFVRMGFTVSDLDDLKNIFPVLPIVILPIKRLTGNI